MLRVKKLLNTSNSIKNILLELLTDPRRLEIRQKLLVASN